MLGDLALLPLLGLPVLFFHELLAIAKYIPHNASFVLSASRLYAAGLLLCIGVNFSRSLAL